MRPAPLFTMHVPEISRHHVGLEFRDPVTRDLVRVEVGVSAEAREFFERMFTVGHVFEMQPHHHVSEVTCDHADWEMEEQVNKALEGS